MTDHHDQLTLSRPDELLDTVAAIARRRGRDQGLTDFEIDDVAQTVLTAYAAALDAGLRPDKVAAYLEVATGNAVKDVRKRAERRKALHADPHGGPTDLVAWAVQVHRATGHASRPPVLDDLLRRVFSLVGEADADVIRRLDLDRSPAAVVAGDLGISVAALHKRASRARTRLRSALEACPDVLEELRLGHPQLYGAD